MIVGWRLGRVLVTAVGLTIACGLLRVVGITSEGLTGVTLHGQGSLCLRGRSGRVHQNSRCSDSSSTSMFEACHGLIEGRGERARITVVHSRLCREQRRRDERDATTAAEDSEQFSHVCVPRLWSSRSNDIPVCTTTSSGRLTTTGAAAAGRGGAVGWQFQASRGAGPFTMN